MRILFEVLERDRFEIYDPNIPAGAESAKIIDASDHQDTVRILSFDPISLSIRDITDEMYREYCGEFDHTAPLWVKQQPDFESVVAERQREAREIAAHERSFSRVA